VSWPEEAFVQDGEERESRRERIDRIFGKPGTQQLAVGQSTNKTASWAGMAFFAAGLVIVLGVIGLSYRVFHAGESVAAAERQGYCEGLTTANLITPATELVKMIRRECE
jgi:hypothetical protein